MSQMMMDEGVTSKQGECEADGHVLLIRHAETVANANHYFLGQLNRPLTDQGEQQAKRAIDGLVAWKPERIYTSPLLRCRDKIAIPAAEALGLEPIIDDRLIEFDFGPIEELTFEQICAQGYPLPWGPRGKDWPPAEGGESMDAFLERVTSIARELEVLPGKTAVVGHGGLIRGFMSAWLGLGADCYDRLVVANVHSFIMRTHHGHASLEHFGVEPELLGRYC